MAPKAKKKTTTKKKTAAKKTAARPKAKAARSKSAGKSKRVVSANSAFMTPMKPSAALAKIVGDAPQPRSEITKRVWAYIKKNGLQDSVDRRSINADATLGPVLDNRKKVTM